MLRLFFCVEKKEDGLRKRIVKQEGKVWKMLLSGYVTGNGCIVMERRIWYNKVES